jgi:hypothetical protein
MRLSLMQLAAPHSEHARPRPVVATSPPGLEPLGRAASRQFFGAIFMDAASGSVRRPPWFDSQSEPPAMGRGPGHRPRLQEPTGAGRVVESAGRPFPFPGCSVGYPGRSNGYALVFWALSSFAVT